MLLSLIPGDVNFTEVWNIFRLEIKELQVISSSFLSGFSLILITPPPPFFLSLRQLGSPSFTPEQEKSFSTL